MVVLAHFSRNWAVKIRYLNFEAAGRNDGKHHGLLNDESVHSIAAVEPTGEYEVILRTNLRLLSNSGKPACRLL